MEKSTRINRYAYNTAGLSYNLIRKRLYNE